MTSPSTTKATTQQSKDRLWRTPTFARSKVMLIAFNQVYRKLWLASIVLIVVVCSFCAIHHTDCWFCVRARMCVHICPWEHMYAYTTSIHNQIQHNKYSHVLPFNRNLPIPLPVFRSQPRRVILFFGSVCGACCRAVAVAALQSHVN